jgi:hypothetical protein
MTPVLQKFAMIGRGSLCGASPVPLARTVVYMEG